MWIYFGAHMVAVRKCLCVVFDSHSVFCQQKAAPKVTFLFKGKQTDLFQRFLLPRPHGQVEGFGNGNFIYRHKEWRDGRFLATVADKVKVVADEKGTPVAHQVFFLQILDGMLQIVLDRLGFDRQFIYTYLREPGFFAQVAESILYVENDAFHFYIFNDMLEESQQRSVVDPIRLRQ